MKPSRTHIMLMCGGLVLLWGGLLASLSQQETQEEEVVWDVAASDVSQIRYSSADLEVSLKPEASRWWADVQHRPDPGGDPSRLERQRFLIHPERQLEIEAALSPLTTPRAWTTLSDERRDMFGLGAQSEPAYMTARTDDGQTRTFQLGKEGYGHRRVYAEEMGSGQVVMLSGELVRALRFAQRDLIDPTLISTRPEDISSVSITSHTPPTSDLALVHHHADEALMRYWSFEARPGRSRVAQRWMVRAMNLRASSAPAPSTALWRQPPTRHITLRITSKDGSHERLDIKAVEDRQAHATHYLATSTRTRDSVVELYAGPAQELLDGVEELVEASTSETLLAPPRHEPGDGHVH